MLTSGCARFGKRHGGHHKLASLDVAHSHVQAVQPQRLVRI
ncbi:hypothetical protein MED121_21650 [Marinomonas sp. MED121]|nr:hypothetical protein MED121_21650 [Marinomonas sp. MED121]